MSKTNKGAKVTTKQCADFFNCSTRTIQNWISEGMPYINRGGRGEPATFWSGEVTKWWLDREIEKRIVVGDGEPYDRQKEEARLKHHQANNEALKEAEAKQELISTDEVVTIYSAGITNCRNRLLAIDKKLRSEFPGVSNEVFNRIYELHADALTQLSSGNIPPKMFDRIEAVLELLDKK